MDRAVEIEVTDLGQQFGFGGGGGAMMRGRGSNRAMAMSAPGMAVPQAAAFDGAKRESQNGLAAFADAKADAGGGAAEGAEAVGSPTIRSNFADTAFWAGGVTTDDGGLAEVSFKMPESLTGWKIKTWAMGLGTKVGQGETTVTTKKNLLVRLQAPRFFVDKDEVVISANVHSYLKGKKSVKVSLEVDGTLLSVMAGEKNAALQTIMLDAGGEQRVDWRVKVASQGNTTVTIKAITDEESDAMQMTFPVYVHGMLKTESWSGVIRPNANSGKVTIRVPKCSCRYCAPPS